MKTLKTAQRTQAQTALAKLREQRPYILAKATPELYATFRRQHLEELRQIRAIEPRAGEHVADWTKRTNPALHAAIMAGTEGYR